MTSLDNLLSNIDKGFDDIVDTPKEGVVQRKKSKTLKDAIQYGKAHLLPGKKGKWSSAKIDKKTDEEIEMLYNLYMQWQTKLKGEMTGRAMRRHFINLYLNGVSKVLKIDDIDQLQREIDEDPIIKDSMANIGALMVTTFGKWLSPVLIACHAANHTEDFVTSWEKQPEAQEKDG